MKKSGKIRFGLGLIVGGATVFSSFYAVADPVLRAGDGRLTPAGRQQRVEELGTRERAVRAQAEARARREGFPIKGRIPGGADFELAGFENNLPFYRMTCNSAAAISTGADRLQLAPFHLDGSHGVLGVWDASSARLTHREFGGRVLSGDNSAAASDHSSHVAGTLCAVGVSANARGMAPAARVVSYDWNMDFVEMTERGAAYPNEPDTIQISSHSYGHAAGWVFTQNPVYTWYGTGTTGGGYEDDFGRYGTRTRELDEVAHGLPYYLIFWAAGNDREHNPRAGDSVRLGAATVSYDPAAHPPGDGVYKNGYDTISFNALAKNVLTVGAVNDAVTGGIRDLGKAGMCGFSSWGPTDDGRIKPDLVANGAALYSCYAGSDSAYGTMSGTSMATPNAAGTAHLLAHALAVLFTNRAMRASTLKALLIHTADDLGPAGPDYRFGWGLVNGPAAAGLLAAYREDPASRRVVEERVSAARPAVEVPLVWDGTSAIRATLCWTDPPAATTAAHDDRTARLVNNLDLRIVGPEGTEHRPWVMPFVGDWRVEACALAAVAGSNAVDNVEQVLIPAPGVAGRYTVRVTFAGALSGESQAFSLVLSGMAAGVATDKPALVSVTPGESGEPFVLYGSNWLFGASARLQRRGFPSVTATSVELAGDRLLARFDTASLAPGWWHAVVDNPDGKGSILWGAFAAPGARWIEACDEGDCLRPRGWLYQKLEGTHAWGLTAAKSYSGSQSAFIVCPTVRTDSALVSPGLTLPAGCSGAQIVFQHDYQFAANDGGVLEFSLDGGTWFDVTAPGSGARVEQHGYTGSVTGSGGSPDSRNPLGSRPAWTGSSGGFRKVVVTLEDAAMYNGRTFRVRWRLGTNNTGGDAGWFVDDIQLLGVDPRPTPPTGWMLRVF